MMKKPTIIAQNIQKQRGTHMPIKQRSHRAIDDLPLKGDWIPFNHENPDLEPGIYWAIGYQQDDRFGMPGLHPFQIIIEILSDIHVQRVLPGASVSWLLFWDYLPHISHVQPVYSPENPYAGTQVREEFAQ